MGQQNGIIIANQDRILTVLSQNNEINGNTFSEKLFQPLIGFPLKSIDEFNDLNAESNIQQRQVLVSKFGS